MKHQRKTAGRLVTVVASMCALMSFAAPEALADGTCTAGASITQLPPTLTLPNPTVRYQGFGNCSIPHWMAITTHLTLDCGFGGPTSSCSNVATGGGSAGWGLRTSMSSTDTYTPTVCPTVPTTLEGTNHVWYLMSYLYVEPATGGSLGWHKAEGYATLPFRCPGLLG